MVAVAVLLDYLLVASACAAGILATSILSTLQHLGSAAMPPFEFSPDVMRDFEILLAAESVLLFGFSVLLASGYYGFTALQAASRVPFILFTTIMILLLFRWRRRLT